MSQSGSDRDRAALDWIEGKEIATVVRGPRLTDVTLYFADGTAAAFLAQERCSECGHIFEGTVLVSTAEPENLLP